MCLWRFLSRTAVESTLFRCSLSSLFSFQFWSVSLHLIAFLTDRINDVSSTWMRFHVVTQMTLFWRYVLCPVFYLSYFEASLLLLKGFLTGQSIVSVQNKWHCNRILCLLSIRCRFHGFESVKYELSLSCLTEVLRVSQRCWWFDN